MTKQSVSKKKVKISLLLEQQRHHHLIKHGLPRHSTVGVVPRNDNRNFIASFAVNLLEV